MHFENLRSEQQKRELRISFRQRADLFQAHQSAFQVERFNEQMIGFLSSRSGTWAAYRAFGFEPRLDKIIESSKHINWVYPKMSEDEIQFFSSDNFATGTLGFEEPVGGKAVSLSAIHGFIIPGVAFDRKGARLGRGQGHYDKMLAKASGTRVGVCFTFQIYEGALPTESFDMKMNAIVSEQGLWSVPQTETALTNRLERV